MDNFNLDELMDLAEAYVGPMVDAIYRRLIERDFALEDPEVVMLLTALINILGHDNRGDRPTEVLLMAAYGERGVLDRPNMRVMRWRNGALSGSDLANEPGLGSSRTYQPGEMPMPSKPKPGLTRMHREMNSEATSSGSPLRAAVPPKRAKVTQKVQTNQTIQDLDEMNDQLRSTKKELDDMTKTMLAMEEDRDMWRKLFEDCNKKQGQEIERLRQENKERSEQVALTTAIEKVIPARDIPRGQSPMELLTPREMSQTTETRLPAEMNRVTIPDPSDTLGDPVVEQTVRKLIETAGRLVANKNAPGSGVTAPYGTIDDTGRVQLSQTVIRQGMSNVTPLMGSSRIPERKVRKMPVKKVSRIIDVQKNNQLKYNFTGVPETDPRACFNRATWSPAVNLQQPPLGTSHLILGDSLVRVLSNLRTSWVTTVMAFGGATRAQLYRMVELMNPGKIPNVMILVGTNDISRGSDEQEALWESMMVCLFTTLWQKFSCAVLTVCTVLMNTRSLKTSGRRHNEGVMRWNNILRNLANRNAGRMILMDIEHELRAMDQARLTTDGIHFDSIEGQAWLNRVFQERLDELEAELFDTGVLKEEGTVSDTVITTFVPPNLETRLGTVPAVTNYRQQSSSEPGRRTDVQDRLGEAPMRRTIHPRRRIGPVNQPIEEVAGTSRSDTRSETTSISREERPSRGSLLWSRPIPSPWHIYKDELMKLDLQRVSFIEDARRMLNGATLSVSRLYSITGVDWLIAASINFSSTTALRFADLEGLPSNNTMGPVNARPLQDVRLNHDERNREERPGRFLTARAPIGQHVKIFRQLTTPPGHVKERVYPKLVNQDGDAQRYGGLTAIKKDETIFAAYDKAEMRKAKIMVVANSEFVYTSKSLFWPDVIMLTAVDLDLLQSVSLAIGIQRQTEMNPITIVFAGINDHLHSRGFLSRLRDPATAENAVWPAIKDILESMGEVVDATKEGSFNKVTLRVVFALSPGYAHLPDGLKFVYAMVALLSEGKYDVIISAPNRMIEMENLRPLRAELPAVWSDISNAMRGFKDHALHMLVLDEVLGLELSNFSRQLKLKPGIDDDHRVITAMSNDLWFRAMEVASEDTRRKNSLETRVHLEAMVLRTKPEANQWLHLNPRVAALGADAFQQGPVMITKIHAYLLKEVNLAENAGEKTAEFVNRMCQITLETFWTQEVKGQEGFERTDSMLEGLGAGWTASFLAKVYPKVSHYLIKEFLQAVVMLLTALINILGHDNRGDRPTEVLLMAAYGERGVLDRPNMRVMRWRNGALSGSDLANEPGLGSSRTYQPGEMPMPSKPKPGLTRMHREMNSEATSSGSPLRAAVPPKRAKVTQKVQTNQTIQDLDEMNDQLRSTKKELDDMTKTMLAMEEDRDMWRKLFEDCNKKQGQEIERLRQENKERSEQVALTTAIEKVIPARDIPRGQSPMELLTPREMSQTTETRLPAEMNRVTIPDPSDTLGDPVVEQTVRKLIETAGRLVANKNAPGSGVTAPYGTIDDTGRVQLSQTVIRQGMSNVTPLMGSSRIPERKVRKMPVKKVSRIIDVQKNNQLKYNFTGVPETDPRACFNRATWSPAVNLQQPPLGTSHLILGDSLVRVLSNLRTSWVTTVMAFGGATRAQLYRMVELMNPGKIPNVMILS